MRKMLKDKKGFTLVELMIVVVIMGILVAVAVPVYNSVTTNARRKTCQSNQNIIATTLSQYQMTGNNGAEFTWTAIISDISGKTYSEMPAGFTNLFNDGLPFCPTNNTAYSITITPNDSNGINTGSVDVSCTDAEDAADHNR